MADISMCAGEECEIRLSCYRFTATPSRLQTYITPPKQGLGCKYFWQNESNPDGHRTPQTE